MNYKQAVECIERMRCKASEHNSKAHDYTQERKLAALARREILKHTPGDISLDIGSGRVQVTSWAQRIVPTGHTTSDVIQQHLPGVIRLAELNLEAKARQHRLQADNLTARAEQAEAYLADIRKKRRENNV